MLLLILKKQSVSASPNPTKIPLPASRTAPTASMTTRGRTENHRLMTLSSLFKSLLYHIPNLFVDHAGLPLPVYGDEPSRFRRRHRAIPFPAPLIEAAPGRFHPVPGKSGGRQPLRNL